jgi:hypothetical protein
MRRAFVGLSAPLFYDYRYPAMNANGEEEPNPILDSPFGLFLLFDEIWFLSRSLCPQSMRGLPYVKFLEESDMLPPLADIAVPDYQEIMSFDSSSAERYERLYGSFSDYQETVRRVGITWDAAADNHSKTL